MDLATDHTTLAGSVQSVAGFIDAISGHARHRHV